MQLNNFNTFCNHEDLVGSIFLQRGKDFISNAICYFGDSQWSHCGVITGSFQFENRIIHKISEATIGGVIGTQLDKYKNTKIEIWRPDLTLILIEIIYKALRWCEANYLGLEGYGYGQIMGFLFQFMLLKIGIKIKNPITEGKVCSEFVMIYLFCLEYFLKEQNISLEVYLKARTTLIENARPKEIEEYLKVSKLFYKE